MPNYQNIEKLYHYDPFPNKVEIPVEDIPDLYVPFDILRNTDTEKILLDDLNRVNIGKFYGVIGRFRCW